MTTCTESHCEEVDAKLVHETLELLPHVTYIRVIIDRINWIIAPKFITDETKRARSPRSRGQIYLTYQIPSLHKASPRGTIRTFKTLAKEVSTDAIVFNDKTVSLCRISPPVIDSWATSDCELKFFHIPANKKSGYCFAKCSIPMSKILVLPFSFDSAKIPLNMLTDLSHCRGYLTACIQLGSRMQHFLERVEPMRNPTTSVDPMTFLDPATVKSPRHDGKMVHRGSCGVGAVEKHFENEKPARVTPANDARRRSSSLHRRPVASSFATGTSGRKSSSSSGRSTPTIIRDANFERRFSYQPSRLFATTTAASETESWRQHQPSKAAFLDAEQRPPVPVNAASSDRHVGGNSGLRPEVEAPSIWRQNEPALETNGFVQSFKNQRSSKDTESTMRSKQNSGSTKRRTVADRFREKESILDANEMINKFPDIASTGYWLEITVGRAKHLCLAGSGSDTQNRHKPNTYVTYRNNDRIFSSDIVTNCSHPKWNWTTQMFVPKDRKNVVFKIWHRSNTENGGKSRDSVIGFVAVDMPTRVIDNVTCWYDIADLSRNSSGQLQVTMGPPSAYNSGRRRTESLSAEEKSPTSTEVSGKNGRNGFAKSQDAPLLIDLNEPQPDQCDSTATLAPNSASIFGAMNFGDRAATNVSAGCGFDPMQRRDSFDPFVDLTSRSVLKSKLRENIEKLSDSLHKLKRSTSYHKDPSFNS